MAREINDGRGRLGGRQAGTPNKVTTDLRVMIKQLLLENVEQIREDLATLEPLERLKYLEKFMAYVVPKAPSMIWDEKSWDEALQLPS